MRKIQISIRYVRRRGISDRLGVNVHVRCRRVTVI